MIKLTCRRKGTPIFVAPENVHSVYSDVLDGRTMVYVGDLAHEVTESPEEVVRKIMEYKLAMQQQKVAYEQALNESIADKLQIKEMLDTHLRELAGLEAKQDD